MRGVRVIRFGLLLTAVGIGIGAYAVGTADGLEYLKRRKQMISEGRTIPDDPPRRIVIAAADSSRSDRLAADLVCTGTNDEAVINRAIAMLTRGGTLQLLDGSYWIDAFPGEGDSAICFGFNDGKARVINFVGTTENKAYNTTFGATLHVTERALRSIVPGRTFRVFYGTSRKPPSRGAFFTYTHVNNVNFENFHLYFHDASKPLIGIDCRNFGSSYMKLVGIYTERYFEDRFMHVRPATPAKGVVGVVTVPAANDEISRIGFDTVQMGGLYTGFLFNGVEHLILQTCGASRCCYGFVFRGGSKTLTLINCADEGNTHLPQFVGRGQITMLDFCVERLNADYIPLDPDGNTEHYAVEDIPGGWQGTLNYTLQGPAFGLDGFWKQGHGTSVTTTRLGMPEPSRAR